MGAPESLWRAAALLPVQGSAELGFIVAGGPSPQRVQDALKVSHKQLHFVIASGLAVTEAFLLRSCSACHRLPFPSGLLARELPAGGIASLATAS